MRDAEIKQIIQEFQLKEDNTRCLVENAFRDGVLKTTGTDVDRILPPMSRFGNARQEKKHRRAWETQKLLW